MGQLIPLEHRSMEGLLERIPPQNLEAEEAIIASLLLDAGAIARVADILRPEHFYFQSLRSIYEVAIALYKDRKPTDLTSVLVALRERGIEKDVGGRKTLRQLAERLVSSVNVDLYASLVIGKARERQLLQAASAIAELVYSPGETQDKLDRAEQLIYAVRDQDSPGGAEHISDICIRIFERISTGQSPGLSTGMIDYDGLTGGFFPGELTIVAGDTGMCKSHYAATIAYEIAKRHNRAVLVFSLEMSAEQVVERAQARVSGVNAQLIRDAQLDENDCGSLLRAIEHLSQLPIYIDQSPLLSVERIRAQVRRLHNQKPALVVVDYLQLMGTSSTASDRVRELDCIVRDFKRLATEFSLSVVLLSQINRSVKDRNNKRPTIHDLRECGAIEQHANRVQGLYRDGYYNPDSPDRDVVEILILKNRSGQTGTVKMLFDPARSWFKNMVGGGA